MIINRTNIIKTKLKIIDENIELVKGNLPENVNEFNFIVYKVKNSS